MTRRPREPQTDGLVFMPSDLFRRSSAASSPHDQQRLRHLRRRRLQPIHGCALRFPKGGLTTATAIPLPPPMAPVAHHMGLPTIRIGTRGQTRLLFSLCFFHRLPPPPILSPPSRVTTIKSALVCEFAFTASVGRDAFIPVLHGFLAQIFVFEQTWRRNFSPTFLPQCLRSRARMASNNSGKVPFLP